MTVYADSFDTLFGSFSVAVASDGTVVATAFGGLEALHARLRLPALMEARRGGHALAEKLAGSSDLTSLGDRGPRRLSAPRLAEGKVLVRDRERTTAARQQVLGYFAGQRRDFTVPLRPIGTPFQRRVWTSLAEIPCGETRTYAELAVRLGSAPRAVGQANARNPICLLLPCHRVIGADGTLTGFAFGTSLKKRLLVHERSIAR